MLFVCMFVCVLEGLNGEIFCNTQRSTGSDILIGEH